MRYPKSSRWQCVAGALACALTTTAQAQAGPGAQLVARINAYRAAPGHCPGRAPQDLAPLQSEAALARVQIGRGTILELALENVDYLAQHAEAISLSGPPNAQAAMALLQPRYCMTLLNPHFSAIGVTRAGDSWQVVLARPMQAIELGNWRDEGRAVLDAINLVRAAPRTCGEAHFPPAPPLAWNEELGLAALGHSRNMATFAYLKHKDTDGHEVGYRAEQAGYRWRSIAENIASGFNTVDQAVASWLDSPGHCANIMNPTVTETGAAYAINTARKPGTVYWTQVFGLPLQ